jgi:hypothetical protein
MHHSCSNDWLTQFSLHKSDTGNVNSLSDNMGLSFGLFAFHTAYVTSCPRDTPWAAIPSVKVWNCNRLTILKYCSDIMSNSSEYSIRIRSWQVGQYKFWHLSALHNFFLDNTNSTFWVLGVELFIHIQHYLLWSDVSCLVQTECLITNASRMYHPNKGPNWYIFA